jgi:tetratricopeptide (TPR) repeat protein
LRQDEALLEKADFYIEKVFSLNPGSPHGHALRGMASFMKGRLVEAAAHLKESHRRDPSNTDALMWLTVVAAFGGHLDTARAYHEKLSAIEPWSGMNPVWVDLYSGRFEVAVEGYRKEYEVDPDSPYTRWAHATTLAWAGRIDEGCDLLEKIARDTPDNVFGWLAPAFSRALHGDADAALRSVTPEFIAAAKGGWQLRWMTASLYAMIGRDDEALDWLELAVTRGFYNYIFLEREPFLKPLNNNPRFQAILAEARRRSEAFEP